MRIDVKGTPPPGVLVSAGLAALGALLTGLHGLQWAAASMEHSATLGLAFFLTFSNVVLFSTITWWPGIPWIGREVPIGALRRIVRGSLGFVTVLAVVVVALFHGEARRGGLMLSSICLASSSWLLAHCVAGIARIVRVPTWILKLSESHTKRYGTLFQELRGILPDGDDSSNPAPPATTRKGRIPRRVRKKTIRQSRLSGRSR